MSFPKHFEMLPIETLLLSHVPGSSVGEGGLNRNHKEAGGKWDAAGEDPSSGSTHDNNSPMTDRIEGHSSSGGALSCI